MELRILANDVEDLRTQVKGLYFALQAEVAEAKAESEPQKPKKEKAKKAEPATLPPVESEPPSAPPEYTEMQVRDILSKIMYQHGSEPEAFDRGKKEMQAVIARHGVRLSVIEPHQYKVLVEDAARSYPHLYEVK